MNINEVLKVVDSLFKKTSSLSTGIVCSTLGITSLFYYFARGRYKNKERCNNNKEIELDLLSVIFDILGSPDHNEAKYLVLGTSATIMGIVFIFGYYTKEEKQ